MNLYMYGYLHFPPGAVLGTMIAMSVGGWLCSSGILGGWPFMFYLFGGLGVAWGVPWYFLAYNHPETHPGISKAELHYITAHRTYVKREKVCQSVSECE